jgi:hypothetical protein
LATEWWLKLFFAVIGWFLLIPILRGLGGVAGTLIGGFSDKSRGFFDGQRKFRQNQRQKAFGKFKAGERGPGWVKSAGFTTGAFLESDKKMRFIGSAARNVGRRNQGGYYAEAVSQQHKLNEMRYGQTERAKATQEDDGYMLQALTYKSVADARRNMLRDLQDSGDTAATQESVDRSISAAQATGGFSAGRQNWATRRLAHTGTGYKNIEQMQRTVARVAGSNTSMAADMLGEMNAVTKGVGRHDLAAGFGNQLAMYQAIQARGGYEAIGAGGTALTADESRQAHLAAAKDVDAVTLLRDKQQAVENMSASLGESFTAAQTRWINSGQTDTGARDEMTRIAGYIGKLEQSGAYASLNNVEMAGERAVSPTSGTGQTQLVPGPTGTPILVPTQNAGRQAVGAVASSSATQVNATTGRLESLYMTRPRVNKKGKPVINPKTGLPEVDIVIDQQTGRPIPLPNLSQDQRAGELMRRHSPQGPGMNPNDPNY